MKSNIIPENFNSPAEAPPGWIISGAISLDVKNDGLADTDSSKEYFFIGFFLSTDAQWDNSDILLTGGRESLSTPITVGAIKTVTIADKMSIPEEPSPGNYYLLAVVDETNLVVESNENDNVAGNRLLHCMIISFSEFYELIGFYNKIHIAIFLNFYQLITQNALCEIITFTIIQFKTIFFNIN